MKHRIILIGLMVLLVAGCDTTNYEPEAVKVNHKQRMERDALGSIIVVTLPDGLRCAVHDHYSTAGTGMSCDWSTYQGD